MFYTLPFISPVVSFFFRSALNFAFNHGGKNASLPVSLIDDTVASLSHLLRMQCCSSKMKQKTVETLVHVTVSALLDERFRDLDETLRATNKVRYGVIHCISTLYIFT